MNQEKKSVHRIYWVWQFEEEEKWLNEMAADGWVLEKAHIGWYEFARCEPGEYILRLEILDKWPGSDQSQEYIRFIESTGAEYVGSLKRWVYFRKKAAEGEFALFSDLGSRVKHIDRVLLMLGMLAFVLGLYLLNSVRLIGTAYAEQDGQAVAVGVTLLVAAALLWLLNGFYKLWKARRKLQAERELRE